MYPRTRVEKTISVGWLLFSEPVRDHGTRSREKLVWVNRFAVFIQELRENQKIGKDGIDFSDNNLGSFSKMLWIEPQLLTEKKRVAFFKIFNCPAHMIYQGTRVMYGLSGTILAYDDNFS